MKKLITKKQFFKIIRELYPDVSEEAEEIFYDSVPLSYIFYKTGLPAFYELYDMEKEKSFSLLEIIGMRADFWKKLGADEKTAQKISSFVKEEKRLKVNKGNVAELRAVIYGRINFYSKVFKFSKEELKFYSMTAEEYKKHKKKK